MKKLFLVVLVPSVLIGCPEPMNTVLIENNSAHNIVFVSVLVSGRDDERVNLLDEGQVIPPGFSQPFCCFFNDIYDVFILTDEPTGDDSAFTEFRWDNQTLIGPMTHIFTIEDSVPMGEGTGETMVRN